MAVPIAAVVAGGFYSVKVDDDAPLPYALVVEKRTAEDRRDSDHVCNSVYVDVSVYAADLDDAGRLGDGLYAILKGARPAFAGAKVGPLQTFGEPRSGHLASRDRNATDVFYQTREYRVRVTRGV
jgi:hypothetical protein